MVIDEGVVAIFCFQIIIDEITSIENIFSFRLIVDEIT